MRYNTSTTILPIPQPLSYHCTILSYTYPIPLPLPPLHLKLARTFWRSRARATCKRSRVQVRGPSNQTALGV